MKRIVKKLREQRAGMVQTSAQYKFLHALVNGWIVERHEKK